MTSAHGYRPGRHLLLDLWGAQSLGDAARLEAVLTAAARAAGATVIASHFRSFPGHAGVTGMVLLAESHVSIHTWPETGFAAIDIFMCGPADPALARRHIEAALTPARARAQEISRGAARAGPGAGPDSGRGAGQGGRPAPFRA